MKSGLALSARAALQVVLVSANSVTLASYASTGHGLTLASAAVWGGAISWVWWQNARDASHSRVTCGRVWYAVGAAAGTVMGAALARVLLSAWP
mgnify:FL=1|jgi:hypothetical protein